MNENLPPVDREKVLTDLIRATLREKKKQRIFTMIYRLLIVVAIIVWGLNQSLFSFWHNDSKEKMTAILPLSGLISHEGTITAREVSHTLDEIASRPQLGGVIIEMNSPGGTPVESARLGEVLHSFAQQHPAIPLAVLVDDICASGCYYAASQAPKIYADSSSLIGSIGVIMPGFGFVNTMKKLGVERRVIASAANKNFLDPFLPEVPAQRRYAQSLLQSVYQQFIHAVQQGRGSRLSDAADLFSGKVWTGEQAKTLGLIDGFANIEQLAASWGAVHIVYVGHKGFPWEKWLNSTSSLHHLMQRGGVWMIAPEALWQPD